MSDKSIRVLLVDDEEDLIEYLSKRLLKAGFTVRMASSGEDAIQVATSQDFDVAVVDLKMPGLDGLETQRRLKALHPFLQTIVLTGHGSIETALQSGKQDAFLYLEKPCDHQTLVGCIRDAAAKKSKAQHEGFQKAMTQISSAGGSPRDILKAVSELKKKFCID